MGFGGFYSAISGLRGHLFSMNVIGNNIANANTPGFKSSRTTFREALVQTIRSGSAPGENLGGQNAIQVGLGMDIASVDTNRSQGVLQNTGIVTDLAVDGEGYFVVASGRDQFYTRAGTFVFDRDGQLVTRGTGHVVQGWVADSTGHVPSGAPLSPLKLPLDLRIPGQATTKVSLKSNLDSAATESLASLVDGGTTGINTVLEKARNGAGGRHSVTVSGVNATQSSRAGTNLSRPGALTAADTLASLGITNFDDFAVTVDGTTTKAINGLTGASTVGDVVAAIGDVPGVDAKLVNGEIQVTRSYHGAGSAYNVVLSAGAAGNISSQLFGAGAGASFDVNNGTASTLVATDSFTPVAGPAQSDSLAIKYDATTGLATQLEGLGGGGVEIRANGSSGLAAGTAVIDTKPTEHLTSVLVYDSLGNTHTLNLKFTKSVTPNEWNWAATFENGEQVNGGDTGKVTFNTDGSIQSWNYDNNAVALSLSPDDAAEAMTVAFSAGTPGELDGLTQTHFPFTARAAAQDGYATGALSSISIDQTGTIAGHFSNGILQTLGQVVLARFNNPEGLERVSGSLYQVGLSTTEAVIGAAGSSVPAQIVSGSLEGSNVDLSEEFVSMIVAQRGFQANARVITTGDQLMGDLINLKQ